MIVREKDIEFKSFRNQKKVKAADDKTQLKISDAEFFAKEIVKCKKDAIYFAENYFTIISNKGKQIIKLFDKQKEMLLSFINHSFTICCACRQFGKSTIYTVYCLHTAMYNEDSNILICANKEKTAKEILARIKFAYEMLPAFLKLGVKTWGSTGVEFENGSKIGISATSPSSARGSSCDILILDEAAFIPNGIMDEFVESVFPTISSRTNGKLIAVSTPNGMGNWFANTWHSAIYNIELNGSDIKNNSEFVSWSPVKADWWDHPNRDERWKKKQMAMFNGDERKFSQEYGNCFLGSSMTLINAETLKLFRKQQQNENTIEPIEETIINRTVKIYKEPIETHTYAMGIDTGEGVGGDFSTILIADVSNVQKMEIVASFGSNNISTSEFAYLVAKLGARYNYCVISGERNGVGKAVFDALWVIYNYENLIFYKNATEIAQVPGIHLTNALKVDACLWTKTILEQQNKFIDFKINEKMIAFELEWFERTEKSARISFSASKNHHDDYIMALVWLLFLLRVDIADNYFRIKSSFSTEYNLEIPKELESLTATKFEFEFENNAIKSEKSIDKTYNNISRNDLPNNTDKNNYIENNNDEIYTDLYNGISETLDTENFSAFF